MRDAADSYEVATRHPRTGRYERWRIRWDLPPDPETGERRRGHRRGFATRKEAETALAEVVGTVSGGTFVVRTDQRLAEYLRRWLAGLSVKSTTRDNYRVCAEVHAIPRIGGLRLADLTPEALDQLYRELERHGKAADGCRTAGITCQANGCAAEKHEGLAPRSVRHVHVMLRKALEEAFQRGHIGRNVADLANPPRQKDVRSKMARDMVRSTKQLRLFLASTTGDRFSPIWHVTATTGLRRAEICGLRWSDIDFARERLRVVRTVTEVRGQIIDQHDGKTAAAERSISIDPTTIQVLKRWKAEQSRERMAASVAWNETGHVFTKADGAAIKPQNISNAFTSRVDDLGMARIGFHGLRHTYATAALRAGVSPEIISKRLGHSSVVITLSIYAHVFEQDDREAARAVADAIFRTS
jgi:integrase